MEPLHIQSKGRGELASKDPKEGWKDCTLNFVLEQAGMTREIIQMTRPEQPLDQFEDEVVMEQLKEGRIIYLPMIMFRAVVGDKTCPLCGATFDGLGALSRRDNETEICADCGTHEAMEDFLPVKK